MDKILESKLSSVTWPKDKSITDYVFEGAVRFGDNIALVDGLTDETLSFKDVIRMSKSVGSYMKKKGLQAHDVVLILLPNTIYYPVVFHAICGVGAIASTCNPLCVPRELVKQMENSNAKYVVTVKEFFPLIVEACKMYPNIHITWLIGDVIWKDMVADDGSAWPVEPVVTDPATHVACLPYSSGTTGLPKGVMLSHRNLVAHEAIVSHPKLVTGGPEDVFVFPMPMFHIYGTFASFVHALRVGVKLVSMSKFDPQRWLEMIQKHKATYLHIVPPIGVLLAKSPIVDKYDMSSVRYVFCGAAPLGVDTHKQLEARLKNGIVSQGYGMTEASPALLLEPTDDVKPGSAGCIVANTKAKVVDTMTGELLGPNQRGELCFQGPQVMLGYLNNEAETNLTIQDGWLHTGDIGYFDDDKHFYVVDRLKELIKYKGYQVPPAELEDLILTHPSIADVCVVGSPDEVAGELPRAYCVKKHGTGIANVTEKEVVEFVAARVSQHKKLRGGVEFIETIPKTPSGKLLRRTLRDQARNQAKLTE